MFGPRVYGDTLSLSLVQAVGSMAVYGVDFLGVAVSVALAAMLVELSSTGGEGRGGF